MFVCLGLPMDAQSIGNEGKIRVSGWDGSQPMGKYGCLAKSFPRPVPVVFVTCKISGTMDTPVEVTLSCHNQEDLDEGPQEQACL